MDDKCFAYRDRYQCSALSVMACLGFRRCPFYKTFHTYLADQDNANLRLNKLSDEQQTYIAETYYHGNMPWRGAYR